MRAVSLSLSSTLLLAGLLSAQAAPGKFRAEKGNNYFKVTTTSAAGNIPFGAIDQTFHIQLPGNKPGVYTTCMSGTSLASTAGGVGGEDVWIGVWDRTTGKVISTAQAKALNTTGTEFGLMLDPTGRYAVFDRASGPYFAKRNAPGLPFPAPVAINDAGTGTGWTGGSYIDPSLGMVGGKLKIFFAKGTSIMMDDFDISKPATPRLGGNSVKVADTSSAGHQPNSPTPIRGADGDVEGLWMANLVSSDNDMVFSADLDPKTPWVTVVDTTGWINNGGVAGGFLSYAGSGWAWDMDVAWLVGDTEKPGGTADITGAMSLGNKQIGSTVVLMSIGEAKALTIPGFKGAFGLNLSVVMPLGAMIHKDATQRGSFNFKIPNDSKLKGSHIALQGISINNITKAVAFTNTTFLNIN